MKKLVSYLPLLLWVTISWTNISLEASDTSTIGNWFGWVITSIFGMLIDLAPYLLMLAWGFLIFGMLKKYINLKRK